MVAGLCGAVKNTTMLMANTTHKQYRIDKSYFVAVIDEIDNKVVCRWLSELPDIPHGHQTHQLGGLIANDGIPQAHIEYLATSHLPTGEAHMERAKGVCQAYLPGGDLQRR